MVSDGQSHHSHKSDIPWPEVKSKNAVPTPYEIFGVKKSAPYSKQRFYELVKIYHPDMHGWSGSAIPQATKLERYRLVIAANDILSDPLKRGAYDAYGAGWHGAPHVLHPDDAQYAKHGSWAGPSSGWSGGPNGPSMNATWEDWERWYQRDKEGPQKPVYFSNGTFIGLIFLFAFIGGLAQTQRLNAFSLNFTAAVDALHTDMSKELIRRRKEAVRLGTKDERIQQFLKVRDPEGYGITDVEESQVRKLLPAPEVCSSRDIEGRPLYVYSPKSLPPPDQKDGAQMDFPKGTTS
jgi:hypothetical protein